MGRGRFIRDDRYPMTLWGVYDHEEDMLLERFKSKTTKDRSYPKVYKSAAAAKNYIERYLQNDFKRYEIYEYVINQK